MEEVASGRAAVIGRAGRCLVFTTGSFVTPFFIMICTIFSPSLR